MRPLVQSLSNKAPFLIVFWSIVFLLNVGPDWHKYSSVREVLETIGSVTLLQGIVAWTALRWLVPKYLDSGRVWAFGLFLLLLLLLASEFNVVLSYYYLETAYPQSYGASYAGIGSLTLPQRMGLSSMVKYIVFSKFPFYFFPAAMLIAVNYYGRQQQLLHLREQKRAAELGALKNQLNPHFIFNTLNNIYALAIKKSERTAEAVAKLSEILDYVLHRSGDERVSLREEVEMIDAYIALERLRFGERVDVEFHINASMSRQVPPLLLLTLLENAFKHSTSQALADASIVIRLAETERHIEFEVSNSKPGLVRESPAKEKIGLRNLREQLTLLYPDSHQLEIAETENRFTATLILEHTT